MTSNKVADEYPWKPLSHEERTRHEILFYTQGPIDGFLPGEQARELFLRSKLPLHVLSQIWNLVDQPQDNVLDAAEFTAAMHLIRQTMRGVPLPKETLPTCLLPPIKRSEVRIPIMNKRELAAYKNLFETMNPERKGHLSSKTVRDLLITSGLPRIKLAQVWDLSDLDRDGKLALDEFCIACHLTRYAKKGRIHFNGPMNILSALPHRMLKTDLAAKKIKMTEVEARKNKLMDIRVKKKAEATRESERAKIWRERLEILRRRHQALRDDNSGVNEVILHADQQQLDKVTNIVQQIEASSELLDREQKEVRRETAHVIMEAEKLAQEVRHLQNEVDKLRENRRRTSQLKELDPFHQLFEEQKEESMTGVPVQKKEFDVHIPFKTDPFNVRKLESTPLSGEELFDCSISDTNSEIEAILGSKKFPDSDSAWPSTCEADLRELTLGFEDNFIDTWGREGLSPYDRNSNVLLEPPSGSPSDDSDFKFSLEDDPVFKTVSVTEEEDDLWCSIPDAVFGAQSDTFKCLQARWAATKERLLQLEQDTQKIDESTSQVKVETSIPETPGGIPEKPESVGISLSAPVTSLRESLARRRQEFTEVTKPQHFAHPKPISVAPDLVAHTTPIQQTYKFENNNNLNSVELVEKPAQESCVVDPALVEETRDLLLEQCLRESCKKLAQETFEACRQSKQEAVIYPDLTADIKHHTTLKQSERLPGLNSSGHLEFAQSRQDSLSSPPSVSASPQVVLRRQKSPRSAVTSGNTPPDSSTTHPLPPPRSSKRKSFSANESQSFLQDFIASKKQLDFEYRNEQQDAKLISGELNRTSINLPPPKPPPRLKKHKRLSQISDLRHSVHVPTRVIEKPLSRSQSLPSKELLISRSGSEGDDNHEQSELLSEIQAALSQNSDINVSFIHITDSNSYVIDKCKDNLVRDVPDNSPNIALDALNANARGNVHVNVIQVSGDTELCQLNYPNASGAKVKFESDIYCEHSEEEKAKEIDSVNVKECWDEKPTINVIDHSDKTITHEINEKDNEIEFAWQESISVFDNVKKNTGLAKEDTVIPALVIRDIIDTEPEIVVQEARIFEETTVTKSEIIKENAVTQSDVIKENTVDQSEVIKENTVTQSDVINENTVTQSDVIKENIVTQSDVIKVNIVTQSDVIKENKVTQSDVIKENIVTQSDVIKENTVTQSDVIKENTVAQSDIDVESTVQDDMDAIERKNELEKLRSQFFKKKSLNVEDDSAVSKTVIDLSGPTTTSVSVTTIQINAQEQVLPNKFDYLPEIVQIQDDTESILAASSASAKPSRTILDLDDHQIQREFTTMETIPEPPHNLPPNIPPNLPPNPPKSKIILDLDDFSNNFSSFNNNNESSTDDLEPVKVTKNKILLDLDDIQTTHDKPQGQHYESDTDAYDLLIDTSEPQESREIDLNRSHDASSPTTPLSPSNAWRLAEESDMSEGEDNFTAEFVPGAANDNDWQIASTADDDDCIGDSGIVLMSYQQRPLNPDLLDFSNPGGSTYVQGQSTYVQGQSVSFSQDSFDLLGSLTDSSEWDRFKSETSASNTSPVLRSSNVSADQSNSDLLCDLSAPSAFSEDFNIMTITPKEADLSEADDINCLSNPSQYQFSMMDLDSLSGAEPTAQLKPEQGLPVHSSMDLDITLEDDNQGARITLHDTDMVHTLQHPVVAALRDDLQLDLNRDKKQDSELLSPDHPSPDMDPVTGLRKTAPLSPLDKARMFVESTEPVYKIKVKDTGDKEISPETVAISLELQQERSEIMDAVRVRKKRMDSWVGDSVDSSSGDTKSDSERKYMERKKRLEMEKHGIAYHEEQEDDNLTPFERTMKQENIRSLFVANGSDIDSRSIGDQDHTKRLWEAKLAEGDVKLYPDHKPQSPATPKIPDYDIKIAKSVQDDNRNEQSLINLDIIKAQKREAEIRREREREAQLRLEREREAQIKLEREREAQIKLEKEREAQILLEKEREARIKLEKEREARIKLEKEHEAQILLEKERKARIRLEKEREANIQKERELQEGKLREQERILREREREAKLQLAREVQERQRHSSSDSDHGKMTIGKLPESVHVRVERDVRKEAEHSEFEHREREHEKVHAHETIVDREIRIQRERERELALLRRSISGSVDTIIHTAPPRSPSPVLSPVPVRVVSSPMVMAASPEPEPERVHVEPAVSYENAIGKKAHTGESIITRELREQREREEELRGRYREMGLDSLLSAQLDTPDTPYNAPEPAQPNISKLPPRALASIKVSQPRMSRSISEPVHLKQPQVPKLVTINTDASSSHSHNAISDISEQPRSPRVHPFEEPDGFDVSYRFVSQNETPIEREMRLSREREDELRLLRGIVTPKNTPAFIEFRDSDAPPTRLPVNYKKGDEGDGKLMQKFASSRLQVEIEKEKRREQDLKQQGMISTLSSERAAGQVKYIDVIPKDNVSEKKLPNWKVLNATQNVISPALSVESVDSISSSPAHNGSPVPHMVEPQSKKKSEPAIVQRYSSHTQQLQATEVDKYRDRPSPTVAESRIERELREMKQREEELNYSPPGNVMNLRRSFSQLQSPEGSEGDKNGHKGSAPEHHQSSNIDQVSKANRRKSALAEEWERKFGANA